MTQEVWTAVDEYLCSSCVPTDPVLESVLDANRQAGLPEIEVAPNQGKLLHLLIQMSGASNVLELGTLGAYSTIWMAKALGKSGRVITLEADEDIAAVARSNLAKAGMQDMVQVRVGPAVDTLPQLHKEGVGPFDFIFVDADKPNNPKYLEWSLKLSRPGTVLVFDNVVRQGKVTSSRCKDGNVKGVRELFEMMNNSPYLEATAIQTVGSKGWDGFAIARVIKPKD